MLALVLALFALADTLTGPVPLPDPGRQVITRAEIETAGLYRLPDLFRLIDGVRTQTVDGFAWRTSSAGRPFGAEAWTLLVDGTRLDFDLFGEQNLSLVPIAITQVDSIKVWRGPRLVAGTLAPGGVIHIHTAQGERGAEARGGFGLGNEVGDPGPYRYVPERSTTNVDKFGADYEALASWSGEGLRAQARFKLLRFYATDIAALRRNQAVIGGNPALRLFAPSLRLEADALGGTHALSALGGGANDLWFFQPYGREIPVRRLWGQIAAHGAVPLGARSSAGYRLALVESLLDEWDGTALGLDPRWHERTVRGGLSAETQRGAWALTIGGEVQRTTADGAEGFTLGTATGQIARTSARSHQRLDLSLAVAEEQATSAVLHTRWALGRWTLGATAGWTERLPEQEGRFGFWRARGYNAIVSDEAFYQTEPLRETTSASLGLDVTGALATGITVEVGATAQRLGGLYLETQRSAPDPDGPAEPPPVRQTGVNVDADGVTASGRLALRAEHGRWSGRMFWDGQFRVGGDADFKRAWEAIPHHQAGASATLAADPSFDISASLTVRSGARWPEYAVLDGGNDGRYDSDLPALWLLDAAAQKTLWRERLRLSLLFRNLLGQEERYHPIGATLDLRFYLRLELVLGR